MDVNGLSPFSCLFMSSLYFSQEMLIYAKNDISRLRMINATKSSKLFNLKLELCLKKSSKFLAKDVENP